jgi:hypothetical protein
MKHQLVAIWDDEDPSESWAESKEELLIQIRQFQDSADMPLTNTLSDIAWEEAAE